jgi:hypothetical protein
MIPTMSDHSRIVAFLIGIGIILIILFFVRRKYLDQLYSLIWILIGLFFISLSFFPKMLDFISIFLGIDFSPIGIVVVSVIGLGSIILHLSTIVTKHNKKIREFEKKIALIEKDKQKNL